MDLEDHAAIAEAFHDAVNMTPADLEAWLKSDQSREVGFKHEGESEAVGHESGRRIVEFKRKKKGDVSDDDVAFMRKVVGYVHRHMAQRPEGDVTATRWRYSLMNWGHDPLEG